MRLALIFSIVLLLAKAAGAQLPVALASPACVACKVDEALWRAKYSDDDWRQILEGEIVVSDAKDESSEHLEGTVRAAALVRHPPKQVWTVLTDFESRSKYVSDVEEIRFVRGEGNRLWYDEHMRFLFVDIQYRVINTVNPETGLISWRLDKSVPHDIADTEGMWQVAPFSGGRNTLLSYRTSIDAGQAVPGFIEAFLLNRSLPTFIQSLRDEIARRFPP